MVEAALTTHMQGLRQTEDLIYQEYGTTVQPILYLVLLWMWSLLWFLWLKISIHSLLAGGDEGRWRKNTMLWFATHLVRQQTGGNPSGGASAFGGLAFWICPPGMISGSPPSFPAKGIVDKIVEAVYKFSERISSAPLGRQRRRHWALL